MQIEYHLIGFIKLKSSYWNKCMKKLLAVRLVTLALFTNQATSAESQFDALVQKKYPIITIFVQGVEQTYQINALKTQDPKVILNELKRN